MPWNIHIVENAGPATIFWRALRSQARRRSPRRARRRRRTTRRRGSWYRGRRARDPPYYTHM